MAGLREKDLAFVRFQGGASDQHCLPYFIAVDHETHNVGTCVCVCVCAGLLLYVCVRVGVRTCVRACVCACVRLGEWVRTHSARELCQEEGPKDGSA